MTREIALSAALCVLGCGGPATDSCEIDGDCERGQICRDGRCEASSGIDAGRGDDGGGSASDAGGSVDAAPDGSCGGGDVPIVLSPPNVLVVIDRSCSMRRTITDGEFGAGPEDPTTRWNIAREAVRRLTERYPTRVRWGLMAYPSALEGCAKAPDPQVVPASGTAAALYTALQTDDVQPFHWCDMGPIQPHQTPTGAALEAALLLPELNGAERDDFVVLITDGAASCGESDASMTDVGSRLQAAGIRTAVIGFGAETTAGTAATMLEALALAGGLADPSGPPSYYQAADGAALDTVLDAIVFPSIPCTFGLLETPPDPSLLHVFANGVELSAGTEWSYDASTNAITLLGDTCTDLRRGDITRLSVLYGCATPTCTPRDEACNGLDDDCDDNVDEACLD